MKTITLPDELADALIKLAKEYTSQDNRSQAMPMYFTIRTDKKTVCPDGYEDDYYYIYESEEIAQDMDELFEWAKEYFDEQLPHEWDDMYQWEKEEWLKEEGVEVFNYKIEHQEQNVFFTAKSCDEHIKNNHYHYTNPISYANTAWRNPEMNLITKLLIQLSKQETK